jgi:hypothetical protein
LGALAACHSARRSGAVLLGDELRNLFDESEAFAAVSVTGDVLASAWLAIDATGLRRAARRLLGEKALDRSFAQDRSRGWRKIDVALRQDPALPASFRANPAQHFYALQNVLAERRRKQWREDCDREPDAFELAA